MIQDDWWYVWIIPMTDSLSESYQWLIIDHIICDWCDSGILSVIGMIQTYQQSLVWFRHIISHRYDSDISSVIGMTHTYYQSLVWLRMTDNISELYQWLIVCLNQTNDWWYVLIIPMTIQTYYQSLVWFKYIISHLYDSDILSIIGMIQKYNRIIPMTDDMSESYQWLILCLNHTNDW
jgi:hypothetical protein